MTAHEEKRRCLTLLPSTRAVDLSGLMAAYNGATDKMPSSVWSLSLGRLIVTYMSEGRAQQAMPTLTASNEILTLSFTSAAPYPLM